MMVVAMDMDQEPTPLNSGIWCLFSDNIMPCMHIDVDVINGYHHLWGGGGAITLNQQAQ